MCLCVGTKLWWVQICLLVRNEGFSNILSSKTIVSKNDGRTHLHSHPLTMTGKHLHVLHTRAHAHTYPLTHARTHTHTHIHTQTHTYTHTHTHTHTQTHTHKRTHTHTHTHAHTRTHTRTHARTHAQIYARLSSTTLRERIGNYRTS